MIQMTTNPEISVVMSVYNGSRYLSESIESILKQEAVDLELIIVNDGSTDNSGMILAKYKKTDRRLKIISQKNTGLTTALIKGCSQSQGEYIARQDVGDISHPKRMIQQKRALDNNQELVFVSSWTSYYGPEMEFLFHYKGQKRDGKPNYIISENEQHGVIDGPTHHSSVMFRKNAYINANGYRKEFYYAQDWDLWYRLAELGKFQILGNYLYHVRITPDNISLSNKKKQEKLGELALMAMRARRKNVTEANILFQAKAIRPMKAQKKSSKRQILAGGNYFIGECLRRNNDARSFTYLKQSIYSFPFFFKAWIRLIQTIQILYGSRSGNKT